MRTLELNSEFNLLGQIDLNSVKIALDRDEMEEIVGGYGGGGGFLTSCAGATVGLVFGFAGLATLTAASGGLATGIAVGGWLYASAQWGASCR